MVYVLEDDESILELILYALKSQNIKALGFKHPDEFSKALSNNKPQIVVLDLMLPSKSGFEITKELKNNPATKSISILILSALNSEMDKVKGLELGADDYIAKPFGVMEFIARIKTIQRRLKPQNQKLEFEGLSMDLIAHSLKINGNFVELTLKEFELLKLLLQNCERVFKRDDILELVWGYACTSSRTLDIHINTLRSKLGALGKHIKTIRAVGYKFSKEA